MTTDMRCQDKERLIAYLYGEDGAGEREIVEAHLTRCAACAREVAELADTRRQVQAWSAPDVDLDFRVVRAPTARERWVMPAWVALPAAAVLVLAAGAAAANLEVRYEPEGGVTVRTGWSRPMAADPGLSAAETSLPTPLASAPVAETPVSAASEAEWRAALAETERRLRQELARATAPASAARPNPSDVLRLIEQSERRQQRELALRLAQVVQDVEAQRRADLVHIDQNLGRIEGLTAARQREVMNYLVRVSEGR